MALRADVPGLARAVTRFVQRQKGALREMMAINSFTENRDGVNEVGDLTASWFAEAVDPNFKARRFLSKYDPYGQHLALSLRRSAEGPRPSLAFVSHLDTVYPSSIETEHNFKWREEHGEDGSWIVGPGSMDIKGGTFMIGAIVHALTEVHPQIVNEVDFHVLLNASEEVRRSASATPIAVATPVAIAIAMACVVDS